jgi:hypothetical protein
MTDVLSKYVHSYFFIKIIFYVLNIQLKKKIILYHIVKIKILKNIK